MGRPVPLAEPQRAGPVRWGIRFGPNPPRRRECVRPHRARAWLERSSLTLHPPLDGLDVNAAADAARCRLPSTGRSTSVAADSRARKKGGERGTDLLAVADHAMRPCLSAAVPCPLPHAVPQSDWKQPIAPHSHLRAPTSTVVSVTQLDLDSTYPSRRRELDGAERRSLSISLPQDSKGD